MTLAMADPGSTGGDVLVHRMERKTVVQPDGCWIWTGHMHAAGYGLITIEGIRFRAHRVAYEVHIGPIPAGLVIDHLCRKRACVNPAHLEPVSIGENVRRGITKTHCIYGHSMSDAYVSSASSTQPGRRRCRQCAVRQQRDIRSARRTGAAK